MAAKALSQSTVGQWWVLEGYWPSGQDSSRPRPDGGVSSWTRSLLGMASPSRSPSRSPFFAKSQGLRSFLPLVSSGPEVFSLPPPPVLPRGSEGRSRG